jgi:tetratricopeptide (TPR) repeat protein
MTKRVSSLAAASPSGDTRPTGLWNQHRLGLLVGLLVLSAAGGAGWWYIAPRVYLEREWQAAQSALDADDFPAARHSLLLCQGGWPNRPDVCFALARLERRAGDLRKAREWLLEAQRLGYTAGRVETEYLLLQAQGGAVKALAPRLRTVLDGESGEAALAYEATVRGWLQVQAVGDAHVACEEWIARFPGDWRARFWLGRVLESENYGALAEKQYRLAAEASPGNFDVRFRLGETLLNLSDFPGARSHLDWCLKTRPADAAVRLALARCLQALGQDQSAESILRDLIGEGSSNVPALILLARTRLGRDDPAGAVELARRAARLEPGNSVAATTLAEALRGIQSVEEAASWEEKARALTEQKEQVKVLTRDAMYHERDVEVRYRLGKLLLSLGRTDEAVSWWRSGLAIDPEHAATLQALASVEAVPARPLSQSNESPRAAEKKPSSP